MNSILLRSRILSYETINSFFNILSAISSKRNHTWSAVRSVSCECFRDNNYTRVNFSVNTFADNTFILAKYRSNKA
ncbi:hypothetical protein Cassandra_0425 [Pseudomonas phage Cassandra]|nr:hypothetical protein Cassandra_0425 [Pseudomonas phage Cassandra]